MEVELSREELEQLRRYAEARGISLEEAATEAAKSELARRYRLTRQQGVVVPFEGLKRPWTGE